MPALLNRALIAAALACASATRSGMSAMSRLEQDSKWLFSAADAEADSAARPAAKPSKPAAADALAKKPASLLAARQAVTQGEAQAVSDEDTPKGVPPLISKLKAIFGELKERRENIKHLERTLAQEKTMLEEGRHMLQLATTKKGKHTFEHQVQSSEQIYKDTASLLAESRKEAMAAAQSLEKEMEKAREVGTDIITEARDQLKDLGAGAGAATSAHSKEQKAQQADDDSQDADDGQEDDDATSN